MFRVFKRLVDEKFIFLSLENLGKVLDVYEVYFFKNKYLVGDNYFLVDVFYIFYIVKVKNMVVFVGVFEKCLYVQVWVDDIIFKLVFVKCIQMNWVNVKLLQ